MKQLRSNFVRNIIQYEFNFLENKSERTNEVMGEQKWNNFQQEVIYHEREKGYLDIYCEIRRSYNWE